MTTARALKDHFREIKIQFFPRWDRANLWSVSNKSKRLGDGNCDRESQVIEIAVQHADPDERDLLLMHEICHAVVSDSHGAVWQRRMEMAAKRADMLKRQALAKMLRDEIVQYQQNGIGIENGYSMIENCVNACPSITLDQVKLYIADQFSMYLPEVEKTFRRIEDVYHKAKQDSHERAVKRRRFASS